MIDTYDDLTIEFNKKNIMEQSSKMEQYFRIKIDCLDGNKTDLEHIAQSQVAPATFHLSPDVFVEVRLFSSGRHLGLSGKSSFLPLDSACNWGEWMTLPIKYCELPEDALLAINVWELVFPRQVVIAAGCTVQVFNKKKTLKRGRKKLRLWAGVEADVFEAKSTPGKVCRASDKLARLEKNIDKYRRKEIASLGWLDQLSIQKIEQSNQAMGSAQTHPFLVIEFDEICKKDYVVFHENEDKKVKYFGARPGLVLMDPDATTETPIETKFRKLTRSMNRDAVDEHLVPSKEEKDALSSIMSLSPLVVLSPEQQNLIWKFRFYLTKQQKVIVKFLQCVHWDDAQEAEHAISILKDYSSKHGLDPTDALQLLSRSFSNAEIRDVAIENLKKIGDKELLGYLLQLVQALRYEPKSSSLTDFLLCRALNSDVIANYLYWYLKVETEDATHGNTYTIILAILKEKLRTKPGGTEIEKNLNLQENLINSLLEHATIVKADKSSFSEQQKKLQDKMGKNDQLRFFSQAISLPLDPSVKVSGIIPEKVEIFSSAMKPLGIPFVRDTTARYDIIFKDGDDLRQDQLALQMIDLMNTVLLQNTLDLKLTPYHLLATSRSAGMVQRVPKSLTLAKVLKDNNDDILQFFRSLSPDGVLKEEIMDNFVKSCAGYCVISYILGIGDRHNDNLLLCDDGRVFHIDFGFLFGRDPKILPPPMKLTKQMVMAMGGVEGTHYKKFLTHCCVAYNILRRRGELFLNLLSLMADANIPDLSVPPNDANRQLAKVWERFHVEMTDGDAAEHIQALLYESMSSLFPQMMEFAHRFKQQVLIGAPPK